MPGMLITNLYGWILKYCFLVFLQFFQEKEFMERALICPRLKQKKINKNMIISGHQPEYLPYLGFFYKMVKADRFILVDNIQFSKGDFQNRNRIRAASDPRGWAWLTVPVVTSGKGYQKIDEIEIDNSTPWARLHWKA